MEKCNEEENKIYIYLEILYSINYSNFTFSNCNGSDSRWESNKRWKAVMQHSGGKIYFAGVKLTKSIGCSYSTAQSCQSSADNFPEEFLSSRAMENVGYILIELRSAANLG